VKAEWGLDSGAVLYLGALAEALTPREPMTVSEWADRYRVLPRAGASEPGRWRTSRTPYLQEPMDCLSDHSPVEEVVLLFGTQLGKTEAGLNWLAYIMHHAPGPMMAVQPTVDLGKRWSQQRVQPMIDESPELSELVKPARSRDSGNTTRLKTFPGGLLVIAGANSSADLRSMPVRYLFMDEVDAYPDDLDEEGSPLELAERRTSTFPRRKLLVTSTPTIAEASHVERRWLVSDQRRYHVPCYHCAGHVVLTDAQLTDEATYVCEHCGRELEEQKAKAHWYDDPPRGRWVPTHPERPVRGYHLSSLYAPLGLGYTWPDIVAMRAEAAQDASYAKTYTNTILGLPFADLVNRLDWEELAARREDWSMRTVPPGCLLVTGGIDVQVNRWAVMLVGWGRQETAWLLDYVELPGDPTNPDDWQALDEYLARPLTNSRGKPMAPRIVAIDSGAWTHEVYQWVRPRQAAGVLAVKGLSTGGKPILVRPQRQDVTRSGKAQRAGVALWTVGGDTALHSLVGRMQADAAAEPGSRRVRFPADLPDEVFRQLSAERWDPDRRRWLVLPGRRNEASDCLKYAYAAACHPSIRVHTMRDADWARLEAELEPATDDLFAAPPEAPSVYRPAQTGGSLYRPARPGRG